ncbi:MAG TPA: thrombospondin type 3 repeat-containing protein [Verrucomicrobiae bacterium]|nr:thrombospondin type 3 repeat-containing protein [Verrucomicrobiae bacterium]
MPRNSSAGRVVVPFLSIPFIVVAGVAALLAIAPVPAEAACPPSVSYPITSGDPAAGPRIVLTGLGAHPQASFFLLGSGDANNSGSLSASDWLKPIGDVDGDGLPDWIVEAPGNGAGGWGDPRTNGCPAFASPPNPPIVILVHQEQEDLDGDGKFDVEEDFRPRNGILDPGEDVDGDGHLTPPGECEGATREDKDCDHHLDFIDEDDNHNGILDPGEDRDGDGRLDDGTEDRNHNNALDDRPDPSVDNDTIPDESGQAGHFYPYGSPRPSRGGVIVLSVAWNGAAYNLQALNTPTTLLRPNEDLDHDGRFDVYEDFRPHNGILDPLEDIDGDGHLTPPDGCEGVNREDKDCDHHLDIFAEDDNHNGILDPGEDRDGDGRLDDGTEDRNHNFALDDRPDPSMANDVIPDESGAFGHFYPYGTAVPGPFRGVTADPLDRALVQATGARLVPPGSLRLGLSVRGITRHDDAAGTRQLFDGSFLTFDPCMGNCPPCLLCAPGPRFLSNGLQGLRVPSGPDLRFDTFTSILPRSGAPSLVGPFALFPQSPGSDTFLARPEVWPGNPTPNLLDADRDLNPAAPAYSPIDNCPGLRSMNVTDSNHDGIGDACDPTVIGGEVANRWSAGPTGPGARGGAAVAYDAGRGVMVLFGGRHAAIGNLDSETWEFDGTWRRRLTDVAPPPRELHKMAYDSVRRRIVLYGGQTDTTSGVPAILGDQWEFDGATGSWTQVSPLAAPGPRLPFGLVYDEARQALVLYGGENPRLAWYDSIKQDTWMYQDGGWRTVPTPQSPGPRRAGDMAWDGLHRVTVLVGGVDYSGHGSGNDVWEFDGLSWQPVDARGDLAPGTGGIASWDKARRQLLLVGGSIGTLGSLFGDVPGAGELTAATRAYDGVRWRFLPSLDATSPKSGQIGVFDQAADRFFLYGGRSGCCDALDAMSILDLADDIDGDGVADAADNCPHSANADQADADGDGSGDACDDCPGLPNADQRDRDRDGLGDACDADRDGDGVPNATDVCPDTVVPARPDSEVLAGGGKDSDGDGIPDDCDLFPTDAGNDSDGDGIADSGDNCPAAPNPGQADSNGDGAGDACQPAVRILSIGPAMTPPHALEARVTLGDPDGDKPFGQVTIEPAAIVPEVVTAMKDPCTNAFLPRGVPGEGIVYAVVPFSTPRLADVDSNAGCNDGQADYRMFEGSCSLGAFGGTDLLLDRPAPFPICVRPVNQYPGFDYIVERVTPTEVVLAAGLPALVSADYAKGRLPHSISLAALPAPGLYVLRITAEDGDTPRVESQLLFDWNGEKSMILTQGGKKNLPPAALRDRRVH